MADKYNIHNRKMNVLNLLSGRERGLVYNSQYKTDITNIKVSQLIKFSESTTGTTNFTSRYFRCHSFSNCPNGDLVGVWQDYIEKKSKIFVFKFIYSSSDDEATSNNPYPFITKMIKEHIVSEDVLITDTAYLSYLKQKPLLYVGNFDTASSAILTFSPCYRWTRDFEWRITSPSFCCASARNSLAFAIGCTGGFYICENLRLSEKYELQDDVLAAEFNDDGNLLFISSFHSGIQLCDMRENIEKSCSSSTYIKEPALSDSSLIANRMKLLSNQVTLIASDRDGDISNIDLRMKKAVFQYPEHKCLQINRPLSIDEDLDLLCAVGSDNCVRIWSLSSGKLNWTRGIGPRSAMNIVDPCPNIACIVSSERRWFIAVLDENSVFSFIPDADEAQQLQIINNVPFLD